MSPPSVVDLHYIYQLYNESGNPETQYIYYYGYTKQSDEMYCRHGIKESCIRAHFDDIKIPSLIIYAQVSLHAFHCVH